MHKRLTSRSAFVSACLVAAILAPAALAVSTHDEYVAQVNPICKSARHQFKKRASQLKTTGNPFFDALEKSALYGKLISKTIRRIARIQPAPGDEAAVASWLDEGRREARLIRKLLGAVKHGEAKRAKVLIKRIATSQRRGQAKAAALGLTACARSRSPGVSGS